MHGVPGARYRMPSTGTYGVSFRRRCTRQVGSLLAEAVSAVEYYLLCAMELRFLVEGRQLLLAEERDGVNVGEGVTQGLDKAEGDPLSLSAWEDYDVVDVRVRSSIGDRPGEADQFTAGPGPDCRAAAKCSLVVSL